MPVIGSICFPGHTIMLWFVIQTKFIVASIVYFSLMSDLGQMHIWSDKYRTPVIAFEQWTF